MPRRKKSNYRSADAARQDRELKEAWDKILKKYPPKVTVTPLGEKPLAYSVGVPANRKHTLIQGASKAVDPVTVARKRKTLNAEMQERERKAQEIIEDRKLMTAPGWNKGPLILITDPAAYKTMGRKV